MAHPETRAALVQLLEPALLRLSRPPGSRLIPRDEIRRDADRLSLQLLGCAEEYRASYAAYRTRQAQPEYPPAIRKLRKAMIDALVARDVLLSTPQRQALTWLVECWAPPDRRPTRRSNVHRQEFAAAVGDTLRQAGLEPRWNQPGHGRQSLYSCILGQLLAAIGERGSENPDKLARAGLRLLRRGSPFVTGPDSSPRPRR
jgi:hypothetical protein